MKVGELIARLGMIVVTAHCASDVVRAAPGPGAKVAMQHARFARLLATSDVRLSSETFDKIGAEIGDHNCRMTSAAVSMVSAELLPLAKAYASEYCQPYMSWLEGVMEPCDGDRPPSWCDDVQAVLERIDFDGYFKTLTTELEVSSSLVRENIMDIILAQFTAHLIGEFGPDPPDRWATNAAVAYLPKATFDQVVSVVERLQNSWVGLPPGVVSQIRRYLQEAEGLSMEQHDKLEALVAKRFSKD